MKTTNPFKKAVQIMIVTAIIISSVVFTRNMIKNIKYMYGLEPAGAGITCFYDMIQ